MPEFSQSGKHLLSLLIGAGVLALIAAGLPHAHVHARLDDLSQPCRAARLHDCYSADPVVALVAVNLPFLFHEHSIEATSEVRAQTHLSPADPRAPPAVS